MNTILAPRCFPHDGGGAGRGGAGRENIRQVKGPSFYRNVSYPHYRRGGAAGGSQLGPVEAPLFAG